jgi:ABC-type uncharacterized transport system fused permease/ATPase subunit
MNKYENKKDVYEYISNDDKNEIETIKNENENKNIKKINFSDCEITTPDESKILIENLNINFIEKKNFLIMGKFFNFLFILLLI